MNNQGRGEGGGYSFVASHLAIDHASLPRRGEGRDGVW